MYVLENRSLQQNCEAGSQCVSKRETRLYVTIEEELVASPVWPHLSKSSHSLADIMRLENQGAEESATSGAGVVSQAFTDDEADSLPTTPHSSNPDTSHDSAFTYPAYPPPASPGLDSPTKLTLPLLPSTLDIAPSGDKVRKLNLETAPLVNNEQITLEECRKGEETVL